MNIVRSLRGGATQNFFMAVVVVSAGLAANGLRGALLDDSSAIGLELAAFWLLTPIVLTPLLAFAMGGASDPSFYLCPLAVTASVACVLAGAAYVSRRTFGACGRIAAYAAAMLFAMAAGAGFPAIDFKLSF